MFKKRSSSSTEVVGLDLEPSHIAAAQVTVNGSIKVRSAAVASLRPGVLRVVHAGGTDEYVVSGGFAEVTATGVSVLAEQALRRADLTADAHARMVEEARAALAAAQGTPRADDAAKTLADVTALGA